MSGEKTEKPTPKKLRDARKKGQVAKSKEVVSASTILAVFLLVWVGGEKGMEMLAELIVLPAIMMDRPFESALNDMLHASFSATLWICIPIGIAVIFSAIAANIFQVGVLFAPEGLKPEMKKINPAEGAKKIFNKDNVFELLKSVFKILTLGLIMVIILRDAIDPMLKVPLVGGAAIMPVLGGILKQTVVFTAALFAAAGAADFMFQKYRHIEKLKMTKDEVKREHKNSEGDPLIKSKRRQMHREMAENNMLNQVRKATVVITNPTHRAVALFYDKEEGGLPRVLGKGADHLAQRIIKVAEEEGIPIMQNIPLARALYDEAEIDRFIPSEFIKPVAEVLRWVRQMQEKEEQERGE